jgi:alkanesulfonate monooxygenase SsuD/methylene tetrahydromethanopterin reductase-like flavin-dependent oxidoreductase (luciferase family)
MKLGMHLHTTRYDLGQLSKMIEDAGFDLVTCDGGLYAMAAHMLEATDHIKVGSGIVPLFQTLPNHHVSEAMFLQRTYGDRFILGMGTQTKGQIRMYMGIADPKPNRMAREALTIMNMIMHSTGEPIRFSGDYFSVNLPAGRGGQNTVAPAVYFSGVNKLNLRLAGEMSDGLVGHPIFPVRYIREAVWPWVDEGLKRAGKTRSDFDMIGMPMVWIAENDEERREGISRAKRNLGRFTITRAYHTFLEMMGWTKERDALLDVVKNSPYGGPFSRDLLEEAISDEMALEACIIGTAEEVVQMAKERYEGLVDTMDMYILGQEDPDEEDTPLNREMVYRVIEAFRSYPR